MVVIGVVIIDGVIVIVVIAITDPVIVVPLIRSLPTTPSTHYQSLLNHQYPAPPSSPSPPSSSSPQLTIILPHSALYSPAPPHPPPTAQTPATASS